MNWKRLMKKYTWKDSAHLLLAGGLCTLGPLGIGMGILWLVQDAIGKDKSFDTDDYIQFIKDNPLYWDATKRMCGEELYKHFNK
jgi:hypothetical protein